MSKIQKILERVLSGTSDANINFDDLRALLKHLGFDERIRGSHHIFTRDNVREILNLQPRGSQAKPYQVKQVRRILLAPRLVVEDESAPPRAQSQGERRPPFPSSPLENRRRIGHTQPRKRTGMNEIRYEIVLYWSKEDQAFIAEVPELPGCAADGATYQEALANAEVVIQEWIETARELGRIVPEPRGRLTFA